MPRKYIKRSDYWDQFKRTPEGRDIIAQEQERKLVGYSPELVGDPLYQAEATRLSNSSGRTSSRRNIIATSTVSDRYANIRGGLLPCEYSDDHVFVSDAIELTQKAYFNVPVVKSTVDIMAEFSNSDLYMTGGTAKSIAFVKKWFEKIKVERVKEQFFLEFYRSGNVFFWRIDAKLTLDGIRSSASKFGISNAAASKIPVRYTLLNPTEVGARDTLYFDESIFVKVLSDYELLKLRNPKTPEEVAIKNAMPKEMRDLIDKKGAASSSSKVYLELDPQVFHAIFYKKQDYEPLAIPMCFCVLDDINKKLELKKVDQAIARSVENVILLVTMGTEPEKGGINAKNLQAMQDIFRNSSVGRVLVADYTTKAEFVIPDMKRVLGKEKYETLNTDIREGLQNIMLGDSKYADGKLKLRVFFQRLDEARDVFLRDFLQPEINRVCKDFGLRNPPTANFTRLDTMDNDALQKIVTRMTELGVLTPEQGIDVINTGEFPDSEDLDKAQEKYKTQREDGKFVPIMSNIPEKQVQMQESQFDKQIEQDDRHHEEDLVSQEKLAKQQAAQKSKEKKAAKRSQVSKPKQAGGRPTGKSNASQEILYSVEAISKTNKEINDFFAHAQVEYKKAKNLKKFTKTQKDLVTELCVKIVASSERGSWGERFAKICEKESEILGLNLLDGVCDIAEEHNLDDYAAAILYHSYKNGVV